MSIQQVSLVEALKCWQGSQETTNRPRQEQPTPYTWSKGSFEVPDLAELEGIDDLDGETTNEIRHSKNRPDREERRRLRSEFIRILLEYIDVYTNLCGV